MTRPFEGIRIIDITHVLAGPFAAYQLAVLGADVIKVEHPDEPEEAPELEQTLFGIADPTGPVISENETDEEAVDEELEEDLLAIEEEEDLPELAADEEQAEPAEDAEEEP